MLVLHGFWSMSGSLRLWAEDSDLLVKSPSQALRSARPHTFAAAADAIAQIHPGKPGTSVLLLPSLRSAPLDSPELIRVIPRPAARTDATLLAWTVPVVQLDAGAALAAIDEPVENIRYGASVGYLAELAAFARELVERGRALPELRRDTHGAIACWRPVLQGRDVVAMTSLTSAMPPVCRAELGGHDPHELVVSALDAMVDAAVRAALPRIDLLPPRRGRPKRRPAVEDWLTALTSPDGRFNAEPDELDALAQALRPWDDVGTGMVGPARATFRLSETETDDRGTSAGSSWRLEFLLQSTEDPSLLVPAEQAWSDDRSLRRWLDRPQELLLTELGRASRIFPELAPGLRTARPSELTLDADGAYRFLSGTAAVLDEAGFGVLLPSWWDRRRKLGLALSAHTPVDGVVSKASKFGRDQLVEFRWELAVGDDTLTEDEIAVLAETKAPLIRLRGQWVALHPDQLRRGLAFLKRTPAGRKTAAEILALAASHPDDVDTPLEVTAVRADGWLGDLLGGAAAQSLRPLEPPDGFTATLRPYQQRGLSWLAFLSSLGLGSCLGDDMGLGKTVQLLSVETLQRHQDPDAGPTLLLCPMSLVGNWQREAVKFAPGLRVYAHHGGARLHGEALRELLEHTDLIVSTYTTATRDIDELAGYEWNRVVLDEAQAVKNSLSRAAKAVRQLRAGHRVALTGTPMENRLAELWSIMDFLNPGLLGSSERFRTRYAIPIERHGHTGPAERLRAVTRPYILRRVKTDPAREDRDQAVLSAHHRAGLAVSGRRRRHDGQDREHRGDRAARQRAGRDDQAQAGVQPPRAAAARSLAGRPPVGEGDPARGDPGRGPGRGRPGAVLHPVHRVRRAAGAAPGRALRPRRRLPARWHPKEAARRDGGPVPVRGRAAHLPAVVEGGRHRAEPHRSQSCCAPGPVVEPGGGEPGDRPGVPDRTAAHGAGAQVRLHGHAGGEDRRDDRGEEGAGRPGGHRRRRLADRTVHPRPPRGVRAVRGSRR